ncbi:MAG: M20 family metallopeptidase [bacterium]|jgi:glutamate carboxypeptidase
MDALLEHARENVAGLTELCRELVECESPTDDAQAVGRFVELVADRLSGLGRVRTLPGGRYGPHLQCEFDLPGQDKDGRIMCLGHSDTVWPVGTLKTMPFRDDGVCLHGPGVLDMKAGIAMLIFAARALCDLGVKVRRNVVLQLNSDEETGSESSRALTEETARGSNAVLVLEPAEGLEGKLKTARKGIGDYVVTVRGRAAHSGLNFSAGASAIVELAKQIEVIAGFSDTARGITVNPGLISGGSRVNVVAAEARVECDMRIVELGQAEEVERKFRALKPFDPRCSIEVTGGLNRPPMERRVSEGLFALAQKAAGELGLELGETLSGGGSDGNFTAALGVPTLDGLGPVGDGAHAAHEHVVIERLPERTALLAKLIQAI